MNMMIAAPVASAVPTAALASDCGFSKWLSDVGTAQKAPAAESNETTVDWEQKRWEVLVAFAPYKELCERIDEAEAAIERWQKRNPWPVEPDYSSQNERIADLKRITEAQSRHAEREGKARMQSGVGKLKAKRLAVDENVLNICQKIADTPARTFGDLRAKSRLAKLEHHTGPIHKRLIEEMQSF